MKKSDNFYKFIRNKKLIVSTAMITIIVIIAFFGPLFMPFKYDEMDVNQRLSPPSSQNFFGTDQFGRDLFSRVIYGTRYSLLIAISVVLLSSFMGITIGIFSGYIGKKTDFFLMRIVDIMFSIPWTLVAIIVVLLLGRGALTIIISLSLVYAPEMARIIRGVTLVLKEKEYVDTGIVSGEKTISILLRYIIPNSLSVVIVQSTMVMAYTLLAEAALSYLGYGIAPPIPSWGLLLQDATRYYVSSPFLIYFPGIAIIFTVLAFSFLGDGLRDFFDPKFSIF